MIDRLRVLELVLRPAIRFCLRYAVSVQEAIPLFKRMLVEASVEEIRKKGGRANTSRVFLMTGISRREIAALLKQGPAPRPKPSLTGRVLVQWEQDERFLTSAGKAKLLTYKGPESEFSKLVWSVSKEYNPPTMLAELERAGVVERVGEKVRLRGVLQYHVGNVEKVMDLMARDCETLITAIEENLYQQRETRNLHIRTDFDNIFEADLPKVRAWLFKEGAEFHRRARAFLSRFDSDLSPDPKKIGGMRVTLGSFGWTSWPKTEQSVGEPDEPEKAA